MVVEKMNHQNKNNKYLLILPCSKQKKKLYGACALELYDGPSYRIVRKNQPKNLDILILSAKYGLINSDNLISHYDQIMTPNRAEELANEIMVKLERTFRNEDYDEVFINLGKKYMLALDESKNILDEHNVNWANGQIGERLHQLKIWLSAIIAKER
ncbi:MAG: hypothetical protein OIN90_19675 [Candidatus Methanoperedens sp.]|nr:hypothetical protein [Candidatus Methanoperedens sp.]